MMTTIVLFHSALGLTPGVRAFAQMLESDAHRVVTPDLFDGETFRTHAEGAKKRDAIGIAQLIARAYAAVEALPPDLVYAGMSMGAAAAQMLAATRPHARAALLIHGAVPLALLGGAPWPPTLPVQLHVGEADPEVDPAALHDLERQPAAQIFKYPGAGHLFTEPADSDYDEANAKLLVTRVRAALGTLS
jgi:dienelactone hydrolase